MRRLAWLVFGVVGGRVRSSALALVTGETDKFA